jgi:putative restriction endonuclease
VTWERTFGHIPGYPEGSRFGSRVELAQAGLHRPLIAGISGSGRTGANSVVLAGGYEDTEDYGAEILYTGHGGRDPETGRQVAHQTLTRGNLALACNKHSAHVQGVTLNHTIFAREARPAMR